MIVGGVIGSLLAGEDSTVIVLGDEEDMVEAVVSAETGLRGELNILVVAEERAINEAEGEVAVKVG